MLTVTKEAAELLTELIDQNEAPDDSAIRLVASQNGIQMKLDTPNADDTTIEHDGRTVLVLDQTISKALDERSLTVEEAEGGRKALSLE